MVVLFGVEPIAGSLLKMVIGNGCSADIDVSTALFATTFAHPKLTLPRGLQYRSAPSRRGGEIGRRTSFRC